MVNSCIFYINRICDNLLFFFLVGGAVLKEIGLGEIIQNLQTIS